jgi:hypothetical protein
MVLEFYKRTNEFFLRTRNFHSPNLPSKEIVEEPVVGLGAINSATAL